MVRLFAIATDPDTERAENLLRSAQIEYRFVDPDREGVLACLERDLDVRRLPFLLSGSGKIEGIEAIEGFVASKK
jgi:hypothetical protein